MRNRIKFDPDSKIIQIGVTLSNSVTPSNTRNVQLVFDTGSTETCLTPYSILGLGYDLDSAEEGKPITTFGRTFTPKTINLGKLSVSGQTIESIDVNIIELPKRITDKGIQGVLGLNFLKHFNYYVNSLCRYIEFERI